MNYLDLRNKYPVFEYKSFNKKIDGENLVVTWQMEAGDLKYQPKIAIFNAADKVKNLDQKIIDNLIFNLGLVEMFSYWKATCSPVVKISAGKLNEWQIKWWRNLLRDGMGQYYYENKIKFTEPDFLALINNSEKLYQGKAPFGLGSLIAIGGGKDSTVTADIFKKKNLQRTGGFAVHTIRQSKAALRIAKDVGINELIEVKRIVDPQLFKLNEQGFINGHTPIVANLSFLAILCAYIFGYEEVVFSNERSANEGNITYLGLEINHQYDKSYNFEKKFREYNKKYLSLINYYSFLRPLYELQTMKIFAKMEKYFKDFRSCNVGGKTDSWCGHCPKCLAVFVGLYPFVKKENLLNIFGENLLEKKNLKPLIKAMLGETGKKPLECIGTIEETKMAFYLSTKKLGKYNGNILSGWDKDNFAPKEKQQWLKEAYENILILGFAREGKSVYKYLRKKFPDKIIKAWDQKNVDGAIKVDNWKEINNWDKFDMIVKSAGIPLKNLPKKIYPKLTSETQIFFDECPGEIIGVTGTKGKSTTAALIYQILKTAGKKTVLVGNIGKPALDFLDEIDKETIVVFELSSHQLQTLTVSPHVAVLTNIYPEHLDYYLDFDDYARTKANIAKFQTEKDYFVFNKNHPLETKAIKIPFDKNIVVESKLLGEHNIYNISAAKKVADIYKISDGIFEKAVANFKPLEHRLEFIGKFKGIKFYNDSLATIPEATISAIEALGNNIDTILLGGFDRRVDFTLLARKILNTNIKNLILFPTTGEKIWNKIVAIDLMAVKKFKSIKVQSMEEAVKASYKFTTPGKVVLLSCASTSFNLFKDYADRGNQFKEWVVKLGKTD